MNPESLLSLTSDQFLNRLASSAPTPGGGAAAALTGALAVALGRMSCALTLGRPRFAAVEPEIRELDARFATADTLLRRLIDEDAAAYEQLSSAFKLSKEEPNRRQKIAEAALWAAATPLEVLAICHQSLRELERLAQIGNPHLASDIEAGQALARASMLAAAANVRANLPWLEPAAAERFSQELERLRPASA